MKQRGFTLIEVLVALAIVSIALMSGLKVSGALTRNAQRQADVLLAQICASSTSAWRCALRVSAPLTLSPLIKAMDTMASATNTSIKVKPDAAALRVLCNELMAPPGKAAGRLCQCSAWAKVGCCWRLPRSA